ncbi:MAG: PaaI family thioesterase [Firmicutes bacterium]|nr:PaaI family thioesterase [Bacillota bacterium]MBQ9708201.1 PaaI family thioesterase [Bacillota bacterium]
MSEKPNIYDFEEYAKNNPYMYHNHVETVSVSEDSVRVKVKLVPESINLHGYVHGGLIYSMADIACGIHSRTDGGEYVTQSSHINYLSNVQEGEIYCDTEIIKRGRTLVIIHFRVTDETGKLLADGVVDYIRKRG